MPLNLRLQTKSALNCHEKCTETPLDSNVV